MVIIIPLIAAISSGVVTFLVMFILQKQKALKNTQLVEEETSNLVPIERLEELENQLKSTKESQKEQLLLLEQDNKDKLEELASILNEIQLIVENKRERLQGRDFVKTTQTLTEQISIDAEKLYNLVGTFERWHDGLSGVKTSIKKMDRMNRGFKSIGSQTGMLSMNASIEAAHAGEAGLGFTIVSEAFADLSNQTEELCEKQTQELHQNDLLITLTFQDTQSGSRMVMNAVDGLKYMVKDLKSSLSKMDRNEDLAKAFDQIIEKLVLVNKFLKS